MIALKRVLVLIAVGLAASSCGGAELTLTEYVEELNRITTTATQEGEMLLSTDRGRVLFAEGPELRNYTPADLQFVLDEVLEIELELLEATGGINPPAAVADLHKSWFNTRFTVARANLADRAGRVDSWQELSESEEMAAYRAALVEEKQLCEDLTRQLAATASLGVFDEVPWLPSELGEVVELALGCDWWPTSPENAYRP